MENITAAWKPGFETLFKADAQRVAEEIASIGEKATPYQILDKAKDKNSELHLLFDWDDTSAAEKYRIYQARKIVCHLVIKETVKENKPPIRFFYKSEAESGYQETRLIIRNQDAYQSLLASALLDLEALRRKYHSLTELDDVFSAIDEAVRGKAS